MRGAVWFTELWGFPEGPSYAETQRKFRMEGEELVCDDAPHPRQFVGPFSTPTLAELRAELSSPPPSAPPARPQLLRFGHVAEPVGVVPLIMDARNAGCVFQAASQFNALEMVGPGVTPQAGIGVYETDPTQGPKCALACPAATLYRNYLHDAGGGPGAGRCQIDCLSDVARVVGNDTFGYWSMQNGYSLPTGPGAMRALGERLLADAGLTLAAEAALRVAVHWDTQVKPPGTHRVTQVFASAAPVAYAKATPSAEWAPFARLVLRAAYDATLTAAAVRSRREGGRRVRVFLTSLGGGAFGNRTEWITSAIRAALERHSHEPLDVVLVHYGTRCPADKLQALPPVKGAAREEKTAEEAEAERLHAERVASSEQEQERAHHVAGLLSAHFAQRQPHADAGT